MVLGRAFGGGDGLGGGGGGGGGDDVLEYGATVTPDADLGGFKTLACVNPTSTTWALQKPTGVAANFVIVCTNSGGTIDFTLGTGVKLFSSEPDGNEWNRRSGATNIIACQWDGTSLRITIRPGTSAAAPTTLAAANMVEFDGTNDFLELNADLTGIVNGRKGLLSCWAFPLDLSADMYLLRGAKSSGEFNNLHLKLNASGFELAADQPGATTVSILAKSDPAKYKVPTGEMVHILLSWDLTVTARLELFLNDTEALLAGTTLADSDIDYTMEDWLVGALEDGLSNGGKFEGGMAEMYFNPDETLDLSTEANRRLFIDVNRQPVPLGSDGSTPTGNAPKIFLSGATATWHTNLGDGGGFTENGAIADFGESP